MARKPLVLLGTGSSLKAAPLDDRSFEFWAVANVAVEIPHCDLVIEIHDGGALAALPSWKKLVEQHLPTLMWPPHPDVPTAAKYPIAEVAARFTPPGRMKPYLRSTLDFMLAYVLLLDERPPAVHLFGFDLQTGTEYEDQQPGAEFWLGLLMGRRIPFTLPPASDMLKVRFVYGVEERQRAAALADLLDQLAQFKEKAERVDQAAQMAFGQMQQLRGAIATLEREVRRTQR